MPPPPGATVLPGPDGPVLIGQVANQGDDPMNPYVSGTLTTLGPDSQVPTSKVLTMSGDPLNLYAPGAPTPQPTTVDMSVKSQASSATVCQPTAAYRFLLV